MPSSSEGQRRWMHVNEPGIASRWEHEAKKEGKPAIKRKKSFRKGK